MRLAVKVTLVALALADCSMSVEGISPTVNIVDAQYDHLGSCFARQAKKNADWGSRVIEERLTDPDEITVTSMLTWGSSPTTWEANFQPADDSQTRIEWRSHSISQRSQRAMELLPSLRVCGIDIPS